MDVTTASITFILTTIGFFMAYYRFILLAKILDPTKKVSFFKKLILYVVYFFALISIQILNGVRTFETICVGRGMEFIFQILAGVMKANVYVFMPLILLLITVKQMSYPFAYTFGNFFCGSNWGELQDNLVLHKGYERFFANISSCLDITEDTPRKFFEEYLEKQEGGEKNKNPIYITLCKIVMSKKVVAHCLWFILAGIYAIMKSKFYTLEIECPGIS